MPESDYLAISGVDGGTTVTAYIPSASATETISGLFSTITYNLPTVNADPSVFNPLDVTLFASPATNQLLSAAAAQTSIPSVTLYMIRTEGNEEVTLSNVTVAASQVTNGGYAFSFDYGSITTSTAPLNQAGQPTQTVTSTVVVPPDASFSSDPLSASTDSHGTSIFANIPGAAGSIMVSGYSQDLPVQDYSLNLSGALGQPLTIDFGDLSTIAGGDSILADAASGTVLPTLDLYLVVGSPRVPTHTVEQVELQNAIITNVAPITDDNGDIVTDELTVTYASASVTDESYDSTGSPVASNTTNFAGDHVTCYGAGTLILTSHGEVAVEDLTVGDLVVTSSGVARPIRWLGHRTLSCHHHSRPEEAHPIRIARHAFGENTPAKDLYVSPAHAICVDVLGEVLIPACALANGSTVKQIEVDQITYWHVELDSHDILIANGLPAESYIDMGNRPFFVESNIVAFDASRGAGFPDPILHMHSEFCRPFVTEGPIVDAVRLQLTRRAETTGWTLNASQPAAGLHLMAGNVRIDPMMHGLTARFAVPPGQHDLWLVSTTSRPCDVTKSADTRNLGVSLAGLAIEDDFDQRRIIALDDPLLRIGFHAFEEGWRWTAGRALLPAAVWNGHKEGFFLLVQLTGPALPRWGQLPGLGYGEGHAPGGGAVRRMC
jgi:type VI protein secretion system component Hcp